MVVCTPCLLPVIKAGATGLTSVFAYSNARDRQFSKKAKKFFFFFKKSENSRKF